MGIQQGGMRTVSVGRCLHHWSQDRRKAAHKGYLDVEKNNTAEVGVTDQSLTQLFEYSNQNRVLTPLVTEKSELSF